MPTLRVATPTTLLGRLAAFILHRCGWEVRVAEPIPDKAVVVVYPHTSNWDFPLGILARTVLHRPMHWIGKDTLFRFPLGWVMRALGGTPVDRSRPHGLVGQLRAVMERHRLYYVVITPEGTRRRTDHWKSGFYHLALELGVPVGLAYLDYGAREVGIAEWLPLTGDTTTDLAKIREIYAPHRGRYPELAGDIRFREKDAN